VLVDPASYWPVRKWLNQKENQNKVDKLKKWNVLISKPLFEHELGTELTMKKQLKSRTPYLSISWCEDGPEIKYVGDQESDR